MALYKVRKRNGAIVTFDKSKIEISIKKAIESVNGTNFDNIPYITNDIIYAIENKINNELPDIELIQDTIEEILIKE